MDEKSHLWSLSNDIHKEKMPVGANMTLCARVSMQSSNEFTVVGVAHDVIHEWLTLSKSSATPLSRARAHSCPK